VDPVQRADDRLRLQQEWYASGLYVGRTIGAELESAATRFPDRGYVFASETEQVRLRFPEALRRSRHVAAGWQRIGLRPRDPIAIQVPNRAELVIAYFAAYLAGLVVVPITHIYGPTEMSFLIRETGARALVVPDRWRSIDYAERVRQLADVPTLAHVIVIGLPEQFDNGVRWTDLTTAAPAPTVVTSPDDVCTILYTSGTTSAPKGVQHTHNSLLAEMRTTAEMVGMREGEAKLAPWPAGHIAGLIGICAGLASGIDTVLMDRWDAALAAHLVGEHHCVSASGTPLHVLALLEAAGKTGADISSLRMFQVGGTNIAPELVERAERVGLRMGRAYGSTEHPTSASSSPDESVFIRSRTDGRPRFGDEVRIVDDDGAVVPNGIEGEIVTRGPAMFIGYRDRTLDDVSFLPGGWFLTGDIGRLDALGYLTVTDRRKDIIIRGGENIASKEVEDVLATHPAVAESAVVGAPDPRYGERVAAFVILVSGQSLDLADIDRHFRAAGIARQKTPERLIVVNELPRTPSGKVQKFELRKRLRDGA
jgi:acyl-CoA synthetase (AMP-forming)/AMP-acid ligase II